MRSRFVARNDRYSTEAKASWWFCPSCFRAPSRPSSPRRTHGRGDCEPTHALQGGFRAVRFQPSEHARDLLVEFAWACGLRSWQPWLFEGRENAFVIRTQLAFEADGLSRSSSATKTRSSSLVQRLFSCCSYEGEGEQVLASERIERFARAAGFRLDGAAKVVGNRGSSRRAWARRPRPSDRRPWRATCRAPCGVMRPRSDEHVVAVDLTPDTPRFSRRKSLQERALVEALSDAVYPPPTKRYVERRALVTVALPDAFCRSSPTVRSHGRGSRVSMLRMQPRWESF